MTPSGAMSCSALVKNKHTGLFSSHVAPSAPRKLTDVVSFFYFNAIKNLNKVEVSFISYPLGGGGGGNGEFCLGACSATSTGAAATCFGPFTPLHV